MMLRARVGAIYANADAFWHSAQLGGGRGISLADLRRPPIGRRPEMHARHARSSADALRCASPMPAAILPRTCGPTPRASSPHDTAHSTGAAATREAYRHEGWRAAAEGGRSSSA